ncbi:cyclic nucleotide-binding domain-containing protein [Oligoflexaceae bacterium]|nr:cyclic nucleotide-binding domain-containing protein [Oligoflexaceae bacterium]
MSTDQNQRSLHDILQSIVFLSCFSFEEFKAIASLGEEKHFPEGSYLMIENEPSRGMHVILDGVVSVLKKSPESDDLQRIATLDLGHSIGEMSLFENAPRTATILAESQTRTFFLDAERFLPYLQSLGWESQANFYKTCALELAGRFRMLNRDHVLTQQLLWKHALRRSEDD